MLVRSNEQLLTGQRQLGIGSLSLALCVSMLCSPAQGLPPLKAVQSGAARYETGNWTVSPTDEASLFTPAGFDKPGKAVLASGDHLGQLKIVVRDKSTGKPTYCRVNVVGPDGNFYQPQPNELASYGLVHEPSARVDGLPRGNRARVPPIRYLGRFFYCTGEVSVDVPPGPVRIEVWKGYEYQPATLDIHIEADQSKTAEIIIERTLPMAEHRYYSGDPHLHFTRQSDADDDLILNLMEADDTHFGAIMVFNHPPGPYTGVMERLITPQLRGMGLRSIARRGDYSIMSGQEYRSTSFGHLNLFLHDLVLPDQKINADDWPLYGDLARAVMDAGGFAFYAHGGYAQSIYADLTQGNINGVELLQFSAYRGLGLADWYHVLNSGFRFPILGASDYPYCRLFGDSKTYVHVEGEADFPKWLKAAAAGRSFVTSGPMLLLEVDDPVGAKPAKPGDQIAKLGGNLQLTARVRVRSDIAPVTHVQLIVNGEVMKELVVPAEQGTGKWLTLERPIEIVKSSWIAARAFSVTAGNAPIAESHTNPVYFYLDGKAPYRRESIDQLIAGVDRQIKFHQGRESDRKADVLAYFERSRDILLKIRAAEGASAAGHPSDILKADTGKVADRGAESKPEENLSELLKPLPPKTPAEALQSFETVDGFCMELVASEPLVCDPIAAEFDENGQLYVCEMRDYPYQPKPGDKPLGCIRLLRDTNGDGVFDESHVFADGLLWAGGVAPWKGGVFVTSPPNIWYLKDTDGDFRADVRNKVFTGFGTQNQQAMLNNLRYAMDHKIYGATAPNGGKVRPAAQSDAEEISVAGRDFRFDPDNLAFETITGTIQFGNTFDDWGNRFVCSESRPLLHVVLPQEYLERNPYLSVPSAIHNLAVAPVPIFRISPIEHWRQIRSQRRVAEGERSANRAGASHHVVDAAAGVTVYRGAAYPAEYYGNVFVGDSQNNLIHRRTLTPSGVTFKSERADKNTEFVRSSDNWFRPVNFVNAPDGTLYVLDMSREIIESVHIPSDVAQHLDLTRGRNQGRIYRLAPPGFRSSPPPRLGDLATIELAAALENPNCWWRETAHRLIRERQDKSCVAALRKLLSDSPIPQARLLALWSLHGLGVLTGADLMQELSDSSPHLREHAIRLSEPRLDASPRLLTKIISLANDPAKRVCFQLAFTLGQASDGRASNALAAMAKTHATDAWLRTAILSSVTNNADRVFLALIRNGEFTETSSGRELLSQLAQIIGARNQEIEVARALLSLVEDAADTSTAFQESMLLALGNGLKLSGARLTLSQAPTRKTQQCLLAVCEKASKAALNGDLKLKQRQRAIGLLGCFDFSEAESTLVELLDPLQPQSVQLAAMEALGDYHHIEIAELILARWQKYVPALRTRAVRLLLSRDRWAATYLAAVQNGKATIAEIDAAGRTQLLKHRNESIRLAAEKLLATSPRDSVIAEYRPAIKLAGDAGRGAEVFKRECAACHRLGEQGFAVGPDLTSLSSRDPEAMLTNILDPNRHVAPANLQYLIVDKLGHSFAGMIVSETATSITLTSGKGVTETILRNNIDELLSTGKSLMPEGLEKTVSPAQMADLLVFLCGLVETKPTSNSRTRDVGTVPGLTEP